MLQKSIILYYIIDMKFVSDDCVASSSRISDVVDKSIESSTPARFYNIQQPTGNFKIEINMHSLEFHYEFSYIDF